MRIQKQDRKVFPNLLKTVNRKHGVCANTPLSNIGLYFTFTLSKHITLRENYLTIATILIIV